VRATVHSCAHPRLVVLDFALQVGTLCTLRSEEPEHKELAWGPVVVLDPTIPQATGTSKTQYCSVSSISARGEGGLTERIFYHLTDNRPHGSNGQGTLSTEDTDGDPVAATATATANQPGFERCCPCTNTRARDSVGKIVCACTFTDTQQ